MLFLGGLEFEFNGSGGDVNGANKEESNKESNHITPDKGRKSSFC